MWKWKGNLKWATRIASAVGSGFGIFLIAFGIFSLFRGVWISGLWWILIGFFVRNASRMSYQRTLIFETLKGEPVARFMKSEVVTVDPDITIERLVEDYVYKYHYKMFPVAHGRELMGCVTTRDVKSVPREEWGDHTVREIFEKCDGNNSIGVNQDATEALQRMHKMGKSRLLVTENGNLAGVLSLENLLEFLSLKLDLEGKGVISRSIGGEGSRRHQL